MQLQLYRSLITISNLSLFLGLAVQQYTAAVSHTAVSTVNSTIEFYMYANFLGKVFISSTKFFA